jgi:hypothetical protein
MITKSFILRSRCVMKFQYIYIYIYVGTELGWPAGAMVPSSFEKKKK